MGMGVRELFTRFAPPADWMSVSVAQQLGESKIASMVESKDFRKGIIQLEWSVNLLLIVIVS